MTAELNKIDVATQSITALAVEMTRGGWQALRDAFGRFLRRDGQEYVDRQLDLFDETAQALQELDSEDSRTRRQLESRLVLQLGAYLDRYPDMADELRALLPEDLEQPQAPGARLNAENNTNSQVVQALGNVDAGTGGINYGVAPRQPEAR
ncbi:hypothetical protein [Streptomyces anthocyanicus]|uniref:hypothetical protein n=1 Tax=Streptomyces anthocyanicus TaxID=68174 RepID=UPI0038180B09